MPSSSPCSPLIRECSWKKTQIEKICKFNFFCPQIQTSFFTSEAVAWRCSVKKYVLENFAILTGKYLCQSLYFNNVAGLNPATLLKKRLLHRCFPVNFAKFLRTTFPTVHLRWLLLRNWNFALNNNIGVSHWLSHKMKTLKLSLQNLQNMHTLVESVLYNKSLELSKQKKLNQHCFKRFTD